jgi:hypothetical protein
MESDIENQELRQRLQLAIQTLRDLRWGLFPDIKVIEKLIDETLAIIEGEQKIQNYFEYKK